MSTVASSRLVQWAVAGAVASPLVLVLPETSLPLLVFNLLVAGAAVLDWLLTPRPAALEIVRLAPDRMSVLGEYKVGVLVRNRSPVRLWVRVRDSVPEEFRAATDALAGTVPARGEARWEYPLTPMARGRFSWGPLHVEYRSVLGLWLRRRVFPAPAQVRVYPSLAMLHRYHILARANWLDTLGIRKERLRRGAWEFESLREYVPGDDVRLIDWKATARRSKPIFRNHEAERNQTVILLVDCGRLMQAEIDGVAKLDHALNTALVLAHVALSRGDRVGLCTFSHKVHSWVAPRTHVAQIRLVTEALYDLRGDFTETDHGRALRLLATRHSKRALLVVLTDFVDAQTAAEMIAHLHLAARRHLVLFAALRDPFLDRAARVHPRDTLEAFRKAAAIELLRDRREVLEQLRQMGAHVLDADPSGVTPPLINRYLQIATRGLL
jgi:uncharacterized protein (DUF58 family)